MTLRLGVQTNVLLACRLIIVVTIVYTPLLLYSYTPKNKKQEKRMKRQNALPIGDMIRRFLREGGLESPLNEYRLIQAWETVLGKAIARYTGQMYIKNQTLYVHLTSPALRQNLQMSRQSLVKRLNEAVGAQVIVDIVFH